jgi:hypothetical protein
MKRTAAQTRKALEGVSVQLAALDLMSVGELAVKYRDLYGEPTRSRNKGYLQKRLAWRVQELADGGLSPRALAKISELGAGLPERWRRRLTALPKDAEPEAPRDPRLPRPGTVLTRVYEGASHCVTVRDEGFAYAGELHKTLSAVAKHITGTAWNGFTFFGLKNAAARAAKEATR